MKIGINICGVAKDNPSANRRIDWIYCFYRIKQRIIDCWKVDGHEVKVYITTYDFGGEVALLLKEYAPFKYQILNPDEINDKYKDGSRLYIQKLSHEFLRDEDLDIIIDTRFEVLFNKNISEYDIDFNKINFLFKELNTKDLVSDIIFIYPKNMLEDLIEFFEDKIKIYKHGGDRSMHDFHKRMVAKRGEDSVHLMTDDVCLSFNDKTNKHYSLIRYPYGVLL
jgi:hypothetical protein